jgi:hypothetical protein
LDIGSGVLEPFVIASLVRSQLSGDRKPRCQVLCIDKDEKVELIIQYLLKGDVRILNHPELSGTIHNECSLNLTQLAKIFPSPESVAGTDNLHLSTKEKLQADIEILRGLGSNPADLAVHIIRQGSRIKIVVSFDRQLSALINFVRCDFLDDISALRSSCPFDLIISNFALQYPIQRGMSTAVATQLDSLFDEWTIFQHGNIYWKEVQFLVAIAATRDRYRFRLDEFAIREVDLPTYPSLDREISRIRTDSIYVGVEHPAYIATKRRDILLQTAQDLGGSSRDFASLGDLVEYMEEVRTNGQDLVAYACATVSGYLAIILPTAVLIDLKLNPLRIGSPSL